MNTFLVRPLRICAYIFMYFYYYFLVQDHPWLRPPIALSSLEFFHTSSSFHWIPVFSSSTALFSNIPTLLWLLVHIQHQTIPSVLSPPSCLLKKWYYFWYDSILLRCWYSTVVYSIVLRFLLEFIRRSDFFFNFLHSICLLLISLCR